jgi:uncharacterized protein YcbX
MWVEQLWRFPVKSMRGERIERAVISEDGVQGDRLVHVADANGVLTARTRAPLLGLAGSLGADGKALVNGLPWDHPEVAAAVSEAAGPGARATRYAGPERFDVLPLLVATDGAIAALGEDGRRLRPNIVIGGVDGLAERDWPGRALRIGEVVIGVYSVRARCVVTTIHPDTIEYDPTVLRKINREFGGRIALNCWVAHGGEIGVGDPVEVEELDLAPPRPGGWIVGAPYLVP